MVNVICPPPVWESHQPAATVAPALLIRGRIERPGRASGAGEVGGASRADGVGGADRASGASGAGGVVNLVAGALRPLRVAGSISGAVASRDFR
jgi:hypothetical protein